MQLFNCQVCGQTLYFENSHCTACGSALGFLPEHMLLATIHGDDDSGWRLHDAGADAPVYRRCGNYIEHAVCNWMLPAHDSQALCTACRLNTTIPDPANPDTRRLWRRLEVAKHRLVYSLLRLGLPVMDRQQSPEQGLAFAFPGKSAAQGNGAVTGHAAGLITINREEADPAAREGTRETLSERYRTLLGHFRHESGHYYWDLLVRDSAWLESFRQQFGDETADYNAALARHYDQGAPRGWEQNWISAYATAHPWEDWAETWAHYLHMIDTLETAGVFGIQMDAPQHTPSSDAWLTEIDPYTEHDFHTLLDHWLPVTLALNSLNRSMGLSDPYPFVLSTASIDKLGFVHRLVREVTTAAGEAPNPD